MDADTAILREKELATELSLRPWIFVTPLENFSFEAWSQNVRMKVIIKTT